MRHYSLEQRDDCSISLTQTVKGLAMARRRGAALHEKERAAESRLRYGLAEIA